MTKDPRSLPEHLKNRLKEMPERPGVYLFKNREKEAVYIGKALSLKKRVAGHFRHYGEKHSKEGMMLSQVHGIDILETPTEAEALLLEASLVKEQLPKYNSMLRDDKSYPFLKLTAEEYPRLLVVRLRKADGGKYFGPYTELKLLKQAVKWLRREFPMRTCKKLPKKVCLMYHIGQCGGPCEGIQAKEEYLRTVKELEYFLEGRRDALVRSLARRMKESSQKQEFEKAKTHYELMKALSTVPVKSARSAEPSRVLEDFQKAFSLPALPRRVECYDISNIQGHEPVGSMVVFQDGKPHRAEYRRFRVKTVKGIDDYRMMREVVGRSYRRRVQENKPLPDLVLIDGGKGHLMAAKAELDSLGLSELPLLSIAKEHEIVFSPKRERPYVLPASSPVLQLVRHLRDEAHRFAIGFHRRLHRKASLVSELDRIPGLGPKGRQKLLKKFGTVARIRQAKEEELVNEAGLNRKAAASVRKALALGAALFFFTSAAWADMVETKKDGILNGKILSDDGKEMKFKDAKGQTRTFKRSEVLFAEKEDNAKKMKNQGREAWEWAKSVPQKVRKTSDQLTEKFIGTVGAPLDRSGANAKSDALARSMDDASRASSDLAKKSMKVDSEIRRQQGEALGVASAKERKGRFASLD